MRTSRLWKKEKIPWSENDNRVLGHLGLIDGLIQQVKSNRN